MIATTLDTLNMCGRSTRCSNNQFKLGDNTIFQREMGQYQSDSMLIAGLHLICFSTEGSIFDRKNNLLLFSGFPTDEYFQLKVTEILRNKCWTTAKLRTTLKLFGLACGGDRNELTKRLIRYLCSPFDVHRIGNIVVPSDSNKAITQTQTLIEQRSGQEHQKLSDLLSHTLQFLKEALDTSACSNQLEVGEVESSKFSIAQIIIICTELDLSLKSDSPINSLPTL